MHVTMFFAGAYVGYKYPKWEADLAADINRVRIEQGMPPLVGGNVWLKYRVPEDK